MDITTVDACDSFHHKGLDFKNLPPTRKSLYLHTSCTGYNAGHIYSYIVKMSLVALRYVIHQNGLSLKKASIGTYIE